jgi:prepilin-type N-terminal cleavage/methylation domain-containing protein
MKVNAKCKMQNAKLICSNHTGFSLLEVLLALAILAMGLSMLGIGFNNSLRNVDMARQEIRGNLIAESIMSEVAAGLILPEPSDVVTYEADPRYAYSIDAEPVTGVDGLVAIVVTVQRTDIQPAYPVKLARWITDPIWLQEQAANNPLLNGTVENMNAASSSSTTTDSSSSGSSGSSSSGTSSGTGGR